MANVFDVAQYILTTHGRMSAMKLQKLVYYAQAWHAVWSEKPLFQEPVEAWVGGPVCPDLYACHRGMFRVSNRNFKHGNIADLNKDEKDSIDIVIEYYGSQNSQQLSELTHQEDPWIHARKGLRPGERGTREITLAAMDEYYSGLS